MPSLTDKYTCVDTVGHFKDSTINKLLSIYNVSVSIPPAENLTGIETPSHLGSRFHQLAAIAGDTMMIANNRYTAEMFTRYDTPVWTYRFKALVNGVPAYMGATHFAEVGFVFNNINGNGYEGENPLGGDTAEAAQSLSHLMSRSWIAFIHSGNPNAHGVEGIAWWPHHQDGDGAQQIVYDYGGAYVEKDDFRSEGIELINTYAMQFGR